MEKCPYCAEDIQDHAIKCKHCGEWLNTPHVQNSKGTPDATANLQQAVSESRGCDSLKSGHFATGMHEHSAPASEDRPPDLPKMEGMVTGGVQSAKPTASISQEPNTTVTKKRRATPFDWAFIIFGLGTHVAYIMYRDNLPLNTLGFSASLGEAVGASLVGIVLFAPLLIYFLRVRIGTGIAIAIFLTLALLYWTSERGIQTAILNEPPTLEVKQLSNAKDAANTLFSDVERTWNGESIPDRNHSEVAVGILKPFLDTLNDFFVSLQVENTEFSTQIANLELLSIIRPEVLCSTEKRNDGNERIKKASLLLDAYSTTIRTRMTEFTTKLENLDMPEDMKKEAIKAYKRRLQDEAITPLNELHEIQRSYIHKMSDLLAFMDGLKEGAYLRKENIVFVDPNNLDEYRRHISSLQALADDEVQCMNRIRQRALKNATEFRDTNHL